MRWLVVGEAFLPLVALSPSCNCSKLTTRIARSWLSSCSRHSHRLDRAPLIDPADRELAGEVDRFRRLPRPVERVVRGGRGVDGDKKRHDQQGHGDGPPGHSHRPNDTGTATGASLVTESPLDPIVDACASTKFATGGFT